MTDQASAPTWLSADEQRRLMLAVNALPFAIEAMRGWEFPAQITADDVIVFLERLGEVLRDHGNRNAAREMKTAEMRHLLVSARDWHSFLNRRDRETGEPIAPEDDIV